jgi:hypothetical protein
LLSERNEGARKDGSRHAARGGAPAKTTREREQQKRAEKLDEVREQVKSGSLVIRQMTDEERRRYPPVARQPKQAGQR